MDKTNGPTFIAPEMSKLQWLNVFLTERLTAAAIGRRGKNDTRVSGRDRPFETGEQSPTA